MNLVNIKVRHKLFGRGTVVSQDEKYIAVQFQDSTKKFLYLTKDSPFFNIMAAEDPKVQSHILQKIADRAAEDAATLKKRIDEEKAQVALAALQKKSEEAERKRKQRQAQKEHDEIYGLTPASLAMLGILDDFYDLYESVFELYRSHLETDPFYFLRKRENKEFLLRKTRKLCEPILNRHIAIFSDEVKKFHATAYAFGWFQMYYVDRAYISDKSKRFYRLISFKVFLGELTDSVARYLLRQKNIQDGDNVHNVDSICKEINQRIGTLALQAATARRIADESVIVSDEPLYLFDSLSQTKCHRDGHPVSPKSFFAKLISGSETIKLPTHYCESCKKHFMGTKTLSLYEKNYGKMFIERKNALDECGNDYHGFACESKLHQLGYNVVDGELSETQRREILVHILSSKKMSYFEVCSSIEQNIQLFKNSIPHRAAVLKWQRDLKFLGDHITTHF